MLSDLAFLQADRARIFWEEFNRTLEENNGEKPRSVIRQQAFDLALEFATAEGACEFNGVSSSKYYS